MRLPSKAFLFVIPALASCGTIVPDLQDPVADGSAGRNYILVQNVIQSINCEIRDAVTAAINFDKEHNKHQQILKDPFWKEFYNNWGAQIGISLTVEEKSGVSPAAIFAAPTLAAATFNLGFGASSTADATRLDKVNFYDSVKQLYTGETGVCSRPSNAPPGSLLIQSDLKLQEWLIDYFIAIDNLQSPEILKSGSALKQNVLSHDVKFEVVYSGNVTPAWN